MFTGIVRERGEICAAERIPGGVRLRIRARESLQGLREGDSIAVNGICQTVVVLDSGCFTVETLEQTLKRTTVDLWRTGDPVNLETPLGATDLLGGHLVTGHVDGVGVIRARIQRAGDVLLRIQPPGDLLVQIFQRGSVAVDGVSLTVVQVQADCFDVTLVPYTLRETTLEFLRAGSRVNLETDMIVKAVQRALGPHLKGRGLTRERLAELGF